MNKTAIREMLRENPGAMLERSATNADLGLAEVIELLPESMWQKIDGSHFVDVMQSLPALGKVTLVMNTPDVIMEFSGELPNGKLSHGFYNFAYNSPLHGHLRANHCKSIYLVERPFMKRQTVSLQFINESGNAMFRFLQDVMKKGSLFRSRLLPCALGFPMQKPERLHEGGRFADFRGNPQYRSFHCTSGGRKRGKSCRHGKKRE